MSLLPSVVRDRLDRLRIMLNPANAAARLKSRPEDQPKSLRSERRPTEKSIERIWSRIEAANPEGGSGRSTLASETDIADAACYENNIENFAGTVKVPFGIAGPMRINGLHAHGDYFVPLATTEAALVASYARGAYVATRAGGISAAMLTEGVLRSPAFVFDNLLEAG